MWTLCDVGLGFCESYRGKSLGEGEALLVPIALDKEGSRQTGFPCLSTTPEEAADLGCTPCPRSAETADHPVISQRAPGLVEAASSCCRVTELSPEEIRSPGAASLAARQG